MNKTEEREVQTSEDLDEDEVNWGMSVAEVRFTTDVVLPDSSPEADAEDVATERLVEAIESGDAEIQWRSSRQTKDDLEYDETMDDLFRCERCDEPWHAGLNELDRDKQGEFYDFDFEGDDDRFVHVCDPCKEEMWEAAHADEEDGDE